MKSLLTRNRLSLFIGMALAVSAGAAYAQNTTGNAAAL